MRQRRLTILGCGTSVGVPMIGCDCAVCTSTNPRNHRTRSSIHLQLSGGGVLVDTTPELRLQMLREKISHADAVLYTHYHADHILGFDDIRLFPKKIGKPVPVYCNAEVEEVLRRTFSYAFGQPRSISDLAVPNVVFERIDTQPFEILGDRVTPVPLIHGRFHVLGFRIDDVAYCTDVSAIPDSSMELLQNLDVLILDALRPGAAYPSHFSLEQSLEVVAKLRPRQTYLTHMSHFMDYDQLLRTLPDGVAPAYDGLIVDF